MHLKVTETFTKKFRLYWRYYFHRAYFVWKVGSRSDDEEVPRLYDSRNFIAV